MPRSGYSDDCEPWDLIRWRGAVASAIRGKRGQEFLKELLAALDALPVKRLIIGKLQDAQGEVCALGSVGLARKCNMTDVYTHCPSSVADFFGITHALAAEIESINDDDFSCGIRETPEERFIRVRKWVVEQIKGSEKPQ